ncbi:hypothetical protein [Allomeiothermus silvanus]|uniref:hypothetical protein n=1 Tax=Allomeiothermus silvanus TaxID=52022 RepID=UPI0023F1C270|nr:hypothetical protein [Allomeiothermus silvanus]
MKKVLFFRDEVAVQEASKLFKEYFVKRYYRDGFLCDEYSFTLRDEKGWPQPALAVEYSAKSEPDVRGFIACVGPELLLD